VEGEDQTTRLDVLEWQSPRVMPPVQVVAYAEEKVLTVGLVSVKPCPLAAAGATANVYDP
jgi:hypothetical protein